MLVAAFAEAVAARSESSTGGGRYATYSADARDLDALLDDLRPRAADEAVAANAQTSRFLDRGPWLLVLLVPLAGFGFRRGWLMCLLLALALQSPRAEAMSWTDLWSRADQQAQAALDAGDAKHAQALAHDPRLRGSAAYRAEDYASAASDFDRSDAEAQYNLGNALARQGKFPEAIAAYDKAAEKCKEAASKYDEASRLQVSDQFKQYLILKAKEYNKRAEMVETAKGTPQALIESTNRSSFVIRAKSNNEKVDQLYKEAEDLGAQADKIQKDNPDAFKK